MADITPTDLAKAADISVPYASQILAGLRNLTLPKALLVYDRTGRQLGPLESLTGAEIDAARKIAA